MKTNLFVKSAVTLFTTAAILVPALTGCADIKAKKAQLDANAFPELQTRQVVTTDDTATLAPGASSTVDSYATLMARFDTMQATLDTMQVSLDAANARADKAEANVTAANDRADQAEKALSKANSDLDAVNTAMAKAMAKAEESEGKLGTEGQANVALRNENSDLKAEISSLKATNSSLQAENKSLKSEVETSTAEVRTFKSSIEMMEAAMAEMEAAGIEADPTNPMGWIDWIPLFRQENGKLACGFEWAIRDCFRGTAQCGRYAGTYYGEEVVVYSSYSTAHQEYAIETFMFSIGWNQRTGQTEIVLEMIDGRIMSMAFYVNGVDGTMVASGDTTVMGYPQIEVEKNGKYGMVELNVSEAMVVVDGHIYLCVGEEAQPTVVYDPGNVVHVQLPDTYEYHEGEHHVIQLPDTFEVREGEHHVTQLPDTYEVREGENHVTQLPDTYEVREGENHVTQLPDTYEFREGEHHVIHGEDTYTVTYTVTYTDGLNGTAFQPQTFEVESGSATPAFNGTIGDIETDNGIRVFTGWSPEVFSTVTCNITYVAQWTQHNTVTPPTFDDVDDTWEAEESKAAPAHNTVVPPAFDDIDDNWQPLDIDDTWTASGVVSVDDTWEASTTITEEKEENDNNVNDSWEASYTTTVEETTYTTTATTSGVDDTWEPSGNIAHNDGNILDMSKLGG